MTPTPAVVMSRRGLSTTIAWALDRERVTYALEGNITASGAAVQWLGGFLDLPNPAEGVAQVAATVEDSGGIYLVPAFAGPGAPHWNDSARRFHGCAWRSLRAGNTARNVAGGNRGAATAPAGRCGRAGRGSGGGDRRLWQLDHP